MPYNTVLAASGGAGYSSCNKIVFKQFYQETVLLWAKAHYFNLGRSHTAIRGAYIICNADIIPIGYIIPTVYHSLQGSDKLRFVEQTKRRGAVSYDVFHHFETAPHFRVLY